MYLGLLKHTFANQERTPNEDHVCYVLHTENYSMVGFPWDIAPSITKTRLKQNLKELNESESLIWDEY